MVQLVIASAQMIKRSIFVGILVVVSAGCSDQSEGFALPPGNAEAGKQVFIELSCHACHSVKGEVQQSEELAHPSIYVKLGGEVTRVKTYGDLVTSIINPSHHFARGRDPRNIDERGKSRMRRYNNEMSVQQLIDLTTFLSGEYSVWTPHYVVYRYM